MRVFSPYLLVQLFLHSSCVMTALAANSIGQPGSSGLDDGSFFVTARFYYYSQFTSESTMTIQQPDDTTRQIPVFGLETDSIKTNALGDQQVLFYDYYAPQKVDSNLNKATVIFYHGGGFQSGSANGACPPYHIEEWLKRGFHGIVVGYRRGWWGDGSGSPSGEADISSLEATRFTSATDMALEDAQKAWLHYNTNSHGHGRWFSGQAASQVYVAHGKATPSYVVIGNSAGGSLVSRTVHTHEYPSTDIKVLGAIAGFGTHDIVEDVLGSHSDVPTIVVTGLFDDISPAYTNRIFYAPLAPVAKGTFDFYEELVSKGYSARLLVSAQKGHGWASFGASTSSPSYCSKTIPDFAIDDNEPSITNMADSYALAFFFHTYQGQAVPNYQHFRFQQDARYINSATFPDIDDAGSLYESIGHNSGKKPNVLTIDPVEVGLGPTEHMQVDGFNYGNDPENGLGLLSVATGFRYEPVQTEIELSSSNGNKPSNIRAKYDL